MTRLPLVSALAAASLLGACTHDTAADRAPRPDPVVRLKPAGEPVWREDLGDPVLRELLRRADAGALDVKLALARLERAQADVEAAGAGQKVRVNVGAEAAAGGRRFDRVRSAATPTLEASYEVDLWGRLRRAHAAAVLDRSAAQDEVAAARLLVGAETVKAYVGLRAAEETLGAAERRRALADQALGLMGRRAAEGVAGREDVAARRQALTAAEAAVAGARAEVALQTIRLGDLLGESAPAAVPPGTLPAPPQAAELTVASDLVDGRPDVQAAQARLAAGDQRRAAAVAAARPQFQITALLGAPDAAIATLLDTRALAWAVAAGVSHNLLDGGADRARIHAATAEADLADLAYRKAVLTGWTEIRSGLAEQAAARAELASAAAALANAQAELRTGETRHAAGAADGLAMSALQEEVEKARDAVRQAQVHAALARVRLALATGGR